MHSFTQSLRRDKLGLIHILHMQNIIFLPPLLHLVYFVDPPQCVGTKFVYPPYKILLKLSKRLFAVRILFIFVKHHNICKTRYINT